MTLDEITPFLAINLLCFALAWLIVRESRYFGGRVADAAEDRVSMVDGLRGWLALGVFFTHAELMRGYFVDGTWGGTQAGFFGMTGQVGVSLFFMITGFLFWGRVRRSAGRLDATALYVSRVRRIVPMYLVSVAMSLAVVAVLSGFRLQVGWVDLIRELRAWFSFGYLPVAGTNGIGDARAINAVYWTLAYEWSFYIALPLLALFSRGRRAFVLFPVAFLYGLQAPVTLNFICGALAALLVERNMLGERFGAPALGVLPLLALAAVFLFPDAYALAPVGLMFVFFLFVVGGNSLFGLLAALPSKLLGTVSYSIYLVHCIVLYALVGAFDAHLPAAVREPAAYWLVVALAAALTVALSALTYRYVEAPWCSPRPAARSDGRISLDGVVGVRQ